MHGPAPTPTKVKTLRGETRPSPVNYREPLPAADAPVMPADMDVEAKTTSGVTFVADTDVLRCYCEAVSRYVKAARLYAGSGPLVRRDGGLVKNPLH